MIMPRGQQLLLPVNPLFMLFTMALALLLDMLQSMAWTGNAAWAPDWLALVLVFWAIHQPLRVGVGVAFVLGLLTDVHQTSLLGQHALTYTVQGYLATMPTGIRTPQSRLSNAGHTKKTICELWMHSINMASPKTSFSCRGT